MATSPSSRPSRPRSTTPWHSWTQPEATSQDLATDLRYLLDEVLHAGSLAVPIRVKLTIGQAQDLGGKTFFADGEHRLVIVGLNLVLADKDLGTYIELEVRDDT